MAIGRNRAMEIDFFASSGVRRRVGMGLDRSRTVRL